MADKLYLGASFVMPMINYSKSFYYSETDASNSTNNDFDRFSLHESFNSKGWGIGAKFGVIYKPESYFRIGFALHTPQLISFIDRLSVDMTTNTEKYAGTQTASSNELNNGYPGEREYTVATPLKTIFSSCYFFAAPKKPTQPLGFISADVEWVNYAGTRFYGNTYDDVTTEYYNALNNTIKSIYKNNLNIKIGSEIKLNGNWMLRAGTAYYGYMYSDPMEATDVYTRQCSVNITAADLATMGATLANGGVNPRTGKQVVQSSNVPKILAEMCMSGLYDSTGDWMYKVGLPGKSGVGGGILAVVPGKLAIGAYSPPLDEFGNSVRGQLAAQALSEQFGLNLFARKA